LVVRNINIVDVRCAEDEVDYGLDSGKSEECDCGGQKDGVSQIMWSMEKDVDADAEEHQVYTWG
jgi:hypothetical protein